MFGKKKVEEENKRRLEELNRKKKLEAAYLNELKRKDGKYNFVYLPYLKITDNEYKHLYIYITLVIFSCCFTHVTNSL
jgi:hypothetical protein